MSPDPGDHVGTALGPYVLGHLEADEAARVRAHLDGCETCRAQADELSSVAALLPLADPGRLGTSIQPPERLLDEVLARIEAERREDTRGRRRSFLVGMGVAAVVAILVAVGLTWAPFGDDGEVVSLAAVRSGVAGEAVIHRDRDNTWVELTASGLTEGETYGLWLEETVTRERVRLGTFTAIEGNVYISLYSTLSRERAAVIGVSSTDGEVVMQAPLPPSV
jgi:anti-sigma-K factor RskA